MKFPKKDNYGEVSWEFPEKCEKISGENLLGSRNKLFDTDEPSNWFAIQVDENDDNHIDGFYLLKTSEFKGLKGVADDKLKDVLAKSNFKMMAPVLVQNFKKNTSSQAGKTLGFVGHLIEHGQLGKNAITQSTSSSNRVQRLPILDVKTGKVRAVGTPKFNKTYTTKFLNENVKNWRSMTVLGTEVAAKDQVKNSKDLPDDKPNQPVEIGLKVLAPMKVEEKKWEKVTCIASLSNQLLDDDFQLVDADPEIPIDVLLSYTGESIQIYGKGYAEMGFPSHEKECKHVFKFKCLETGEFTLAVQFLQKNKQLMNIPFNINCSETL